MGKTKSKSKAKNRHGPHTAAKSEISGHTYSNVFPNSFTNECFTFTELLQSKWTQNNVLDKEA